MAYTINTNITSLQAQEYLRVTTEFQSKTINRVTSGLRIISSGDDAAGLAIANAFRSDRAVLTQGVRNANDGLSTLQTIDGGINNISQLLDRARTLAAQSASGTFNGDRAVLDSEFQSVLTEIDRQAQAIGLNEGGTFARELSVFIGGGRSVGAVSEIANGSVSVDLSSSLVDAASLGLATYETADGADIRAGSSTSLQQLVSSNDQAATFVFNGAGFSAISVSVANGDVDNLNSEQELVDAINAAIANVSTSTTDGLNFQNANIRAALAEGANGEKSLVFTSGDSAFHVQGSTNLSAALLGAVTGTTGDSTAAGARKIAGGVTGVQTLAYTDMDAGDAQTIIVSTRDADGALVQATISLSGANTLAQAVTAINTALQTDTTSPLAGIFAVADGASGSKISFVAKDIEFQVNASTTLDTGAAVAHGLNDGTAGMWGSAEIGTGGTVSIDTVDNAEAAVSALATAVSSLGAAQAVVGKGQNNFNFAVSLAQTQLNNLAASESRIRDADLAAEAANLTKAQILQQAGIAALAQANVAPQAVLSLLRG